MKVYASAEMTLTDTNDGISVTGIDRYYMASSSSSGITVDSQGWKPDPQETNPISRYHWSYEVVNYSDGAKIPSKPAIIGVYGKEGVDAVTVSLSSEAHTFAGTESKAIASSITIDISAFKGNQRIPTSIGNVTGGIAGQLTHSELGRGTTSNKLVINVTNALNKSHGTLSMPIVADGKTFNKVFSWSVAFKGIPGDKGDTGDKGDKGDTGDKGAAGTGIKSSEISYVIHTNGTTAPTLGWVSTVPTPKQGRYLWTRTITTYTDNTTSTTYSVAYQATNGQQGDAGNGVSSTTVTYAQTTSGTTTPTSWSSTRPAPIKGQYLWSRTIITYTNGSSSTAYNTSYSATDGQKGDKGDKGDTGPRGPQGIEGPKGANGEPTYTWIRYADTPTSGMSNSPVGKKYIGLSFNQTTQTESSSYSAYQWSLMPQNIEIGGRNLLKDSKPDTPINNSSYNIMNFYLTEKPVVGETYTFVLKGELAPTRTAFYIYNSGPSISFGSLKKDGDYYVSTFTWKNTNGSYNANDTFVSIYQFTNSQSGSSTIEWATLMKGDAVIKDWTPAPEDTQSEIDNTKEQVKKTVKTITEEYYQSTSATSQTGGGWTETPPTWKEGRFIFIRSKITYVDGTTDYTPIVNITGAKGDTGPRGPQGIQGPSGSNGQSQWVHVRYSPNPTGSGMTTTPSSTTKYVGIAVTNSATAPGYTSFTWSKYVGEDGSRGPQGLPGQKGDDGTTTYTWIRYADTPTSGMNQYPDGKKYIGMAFNKTTQTESSNYSDYQWSLMPQNIEIGGRNYFSLTHLNNISPSSWVVNAYVYNFTLEPNTKYILSSNVPTDGNASETVLYFNGSGTGSNGAWLNNPRIMETDNEGKFYIAVPTGRTYTSAILNGDYWVQLEKGNTATDWSPAPEDLYQYVDNIEVGSTNLLKDSRTIFLSSNNNATYPASITDMEENGRSFSRVRRTNLNLSPSIFSIYSDISIEDINKSIFDNESTVISFKARASQNVTMKTMSTTHGGSLLVTGSLGDINVTTEWKTFYSIFPKIPKSASGFRVNPLNNITDVNMSTFYIDLCEWKIEKGNKPTDWSPAPEDVQAEINDKASAEDLTDVSNDLNTSIGDLSNTVDGKVDTSIYEQFLEHNANIQEQLSISTANAQEDITKALARTATVEQKLGEGAADWIFTHTQIRMSDEGITLGEEGSGSYLQITNDQISFYNGSEEPVAFINGGMLHINHAIFVESIQISEFMFSSEISGHLTLRYVGN